MTPPIAIFGLSAELSAAVIAVLVAFITTLLASPVRYVVDRRLQRTAKEAEYEFEQRKKLRDEIEKKGPLMSADARREKQEQFDRKRRDAARAADDYQKELEKKEGQLLQKVLQEVGGVIEKQMNELKSETLATAMSRQMGLFSGLLWGIKWLLGPAIVLVMTVILANSISITVRERMKEMAVMKVLGFGRRQIISSLEGPSRMCRTASSSGP